ncbi:flavin reductase family protein [Skermania sp. ID1734]|nr:flavin reductase family protein [Skermania sp. ID1734]
MADPATLRTVFAQFPAGVVAVCALVDSEPRGLAVSTFTPVSLEPALVSICVQNTSSTWPVLRTANRIGLSLLGSGQEDAARALSARRADRFAQMSLTRRGSAIFVDGGAAWIEASLDGEVLAGDHTVAVLRIHGLGKRVDVNPLVFHDSRFRALESENGSGRRQHVCAAAHDRPPQHAENDDAGPRQDETGARVSDSRRLRVL